MPEVEFCCKRMKSECDIAFRLIYDPCEDAVIYMGEIEMNYRTVKNPILMDCPFCKQEIFPNYSKQKFDEKN